MEVVILLAALSGLVYLSVKRKNGRVRRELRAFLGLKDGESYYMCGTPCWMTLDVHRAIAAFFASEGMQVRARGHGALYHALTGDTPVGLNQLLDRSWFGELGVPDTERCETESEHFEVFPDKCVYEVTGGPHPLLFTRYLHLVTASGLEAAVPSHPAAQAWLDGLMKRFHEWCVAHSFYRGRTVSPQFDVVGICIALRLMPDEQAPVTLEPELAESIESSFLAFWRHRDVLRDAGIGAARGLLLCGEPGTGKSTTCRYLRQQLPAHTVFVIDSTALASMRHVFELARKMTPSLVVIEDVDLILQSREATGGSAALKDLMNALDGLEERAEVSVVLTSNSWHFMEEAVADRPGRIDQVIFYGRPARAQRERLLESFTARLTIAGDLAAAAQATDGFSPAQLRELVKRAAVAALRRDAAAPITDADFTEAVKSVKAANLTAVSRAHGKRGGRVVGLIS